VRKGVDSPASRSEAYHDSVAHIRERLERERSERQRDQDSVHSGRGLSASRLAPGSQRRTGSLTSMRQSSAPSVQRSVSQASSHVAEAPLAPVNGHAARAASEDARRHEIEEAAFAKTKPLRDVILVLEARVKAMEDAEEQVRLLTDRCEEWRSECDQVRQLRQQELQQFQQAQQEQRARFDEQQQQQDDLRARMRQTEELLLNRTEARDQALRELSGAKASVLLYEGKLRVHESLEREVTTRQVEEGETLSGRQQLQQEYARAVEKFELTLETLRADLCAAGEEKAELLLRLQELQTLYDEQLQEQEQTGQAGAPALLEAERRQRAHDKADLEHWKAQCEQANARAAQLDQELAQVHVRFQEDLAAERRKQEQLSAELLQKQKQHAEQCGLQTERQSAVSHLASEKNQALNEVASLKARLVALVGHEEAAARMRQSLQLAEEARARVQREMQELQEEHAAEMQAQRAELADARAQLADLGVQHARAQTELRVERHERGQLELKQTELTSIVVTLDAQVFGLNDCQEQLKAHKEIVQHNDVERERLKAAIAAMTAGFEDAMEQWKRDKQQLEQDLIAKQGEVRTMMAKLADLQIGYVPVKGDPIDSALAERIAQRPPPVPFFRQQPGVYLFGTRTCIATIQHDMLVFRVGGGFLQYDSFIEAHGDEEREKLILE